MLFKRFSQSAVAVAVSTILFSSALLANEKQSDQPNIERIAVWSTKVNSSSLYLQGDNLADKQADHISDLLRTIPGVDVGGAHSLNQRITIRSMDDKDLKISIDGASQNSYMYHHMGNLQIHADILKSVDVQVGSNSIINGGLGGAVKFETKDARDLLSAEQQFGARVQVSAGDNSGTNYSVTAYGLLTNDIDFLGYYNFVDRDNYDVGGGKLKDEQGLELADTNGKVQGLEGEMADSLLKFGWNINNEQRLELSYESYQDEGKYSYRPDMGLATDLKITELLMVPLLWPTKFTRDTLTLNYQLAWGQTSTLAFVAYSNISELWRDEMAYTRKPAVVTGEAKNTGFNLIGTTAIEGAFDHDLTYGIDVVKYETKYQAKTLSTNDDSSEHATNASLFIEDNISLGHGVSIIPGIRYDSYNIDSTIVDNTYNDTSFALAVSYHVTDNFVLKASITELFKAPEIGEVFVGAGLFDGDKVNQVMTAESGENIEYAFAYQTETSNDSTFSIGGTYFNTHIDDYIYDYAKNSNGGKRAKWKDNIGDMELEGYEAYMGFNYQLLSTQITYSTVESDLNAFNEYASLENARLDRHQGNTLSANVSYELPEYNLSLHWELMKVADVKDELTLDGATKNNAKDGFTLHNIQARWQPEAVSGLTVLFGVDNLFDEYYVSQSSRTGTSWHPLFKDLYLIDYEPGRNIKMTISYSF